MLISTGVWKLLSTIRELGYGEMFGVTVNETGETIEAELNQNERELVAWLEENSEIDILTVHNGKPVLLEVDYKQNGFRCRKKVKFPTG